MDNLFLKKPGEVEFIEVSGIPVKITWKMTHNLYIYVKPPDGRVEATMPCILSEEDVRIFVKSRLPWIKKQQKKHSSRDFSLREDFLSQEKFLLWGKPYSLDIQEGKGYSFSLEGDRAVFIVRQGSTREQQESWIRKWCRGLLKSAIEERLPVWESITGIHCNTWYVKAMTTRWGSCNPFAGRIWLNLHLVRKNPECLDYVLLHEIAHLQVQNHGPEFVAFMDQYMPQWKAIRKKMRQMRHR